MNAEQYDALYRGHIYRVEEELIRSVVAVSTGKWLDVGCGTGSICDRWRGFAPETYIGIDSSDDMVAAAAARGLNVHAGSGAALPFMDHEFDLVTALWSVATYGDVVTHINELVRVVASGGQLIVVCYGHRRLKVAENINAVMHCGTPHVWRARELRSILLRSGLHEVTVRGLRSLPAYTGNGLRGSLSGVVLRAEWHVLSRILADYALYLVGTGRRYGNAT